ncbi:MAG: pseudouridine-5'-phosphate glycosidase [Spirochaetales bacterium]|nr:pseudouridine-5'-phosphate glycosidase [Candidatus Physcosoma equi]
MTKYLDCSEEVKEALASGKPIVALESTIISHGMPYPRNVETALMVEEEVRKCGAVPATTAIIQGRLKAGLSADEIEYFGKKGLAITKTSRRDIPAILARKEDGASTVATTMIIAAAAGIDVFATGGVGGVHRGAQQTFDISADMDEFSKTPVMVVCAGAKAILDLPLTLEYLETKGVNVIGYGTDELPAFYTRKSGLKVTWRCDTPKEIADIWTVQKDFLPNTGLLVTNPIPEKYSMDPDYINKEIEVAIEEMNKLGIKGKETTPFLLDKIQKLTGGSSLESNIQLVLINARLASAIAVELKK